MQVLVALGLAPQRNMLSPPPALLSQLRKPSQPPLGVRNPEMNDRRMSGDAGELQYLLFSLFPLLSTESWPSPQAWLHPSVPSHDGAAFSDLAPRLAYPGLLWHPCLVAARPRAACSGSRAEKFVRLLGTGHAAHAVVNRPGGPARKSRPQALQQEHTA